jgi:hypothetical protein
LQPIGGVLRARGGGFGGNVQVGTQVDLFDRFRTRNDFHGGTLGVLTSLDYGAVSLDIATKLGVGRMWRESVIDGQTHVRTPVGAKLIRPAVCWLCLRTWERTGTARSACCPSWI